MMEGEYSGQHKCEDCGVEMEEEVLRSAAGYYIGTQCNCGPYGRGSHYYPTREAAQADLDAQTVNRRDTDFHPGELVIVELDDETTIDDLWEAFHGN